MLARMDHLSGVPSHIVQVCSPERYISCPEANRPLVHEPGLLRLVRQTEPGLKRTMPYPFRVYVTLYENGQASNQGGPFPNLQNPELWSGLTFTLNLDLAVQNSRASHRLGLANLEPQLAVNAAFLYLWEKIKLGASRPHYTEWERRTMSEIFADEEIDRIRYAGASPIILI